MPSASQSAYRSSARCFLFFFSSSRRHTRCLSDWSSDVCSSDLLGSSLGFELEGDAGDLLDGFGVSLCDGERSGAAIERARELLLGIELGLGTEGARQGDDFLNDGDFLFGLGVGEFGAVLRVGGERDGFRVALGEVEALPEFFGEEGHGGMQQAQGGLEGGGGVAPARGADLFQLEIPIAEFVPEELPELLGELVVAVLLDGAVGGLGG